MRDTVKTLAGLLVIAVIVVATFLYGNAQRQAQLKHDQQIKNQQANASTGSQVANASPAPTAAEQASPSPQTNTAPVQSPQANTLQGGSTATPKPKATPVATPVATPAPTVVAIAPTAPKLPQTGSSLGSVFGLAALVGAAVAFVYSKRTLLAAARAKR